jgi:anti-sigma regulatory factor (Ser/Thr protein kinase)
VELVTTVNASKTFECDLETIKLVREWIVDVLSAHSTPNDIINDIVLAANEAVTNSVVHGYAETRRGRIDISIELLDGLVSLKIRDYGSGLGRTPYIAPDTRIPHEGGYGVYLVRALMDEVEVLSLDKGVEVRMKKTIKPIKGL